MSQKRIVLENEYYEVSAKFKQDADLQEVLSVVEGLIRALGYSAHGHLDFVEDEE